MRKAFAIIGAIISGIFSSICCIGPIVFSLMGAGFVGFSVFERYRPLFILISFIFLGTSWFLTLNKREIKCEGGTCRREGPSKFQITFMTLLTLLVLFFIFFPQILTKFLGG